MRLAMSITGWSRRAAGLLTPTGAGGGRASE
jgi:hypothetical protein